jgi:hypothetical protein
MLGLIQEMRDAGLSNKQIVEEIACCVMFALFLIVVCFI